MGTKSDNVRYVVYIEMALFVFESLTILAGIIFSTNFENIILNHFISEDKKSDTQEMIRKYLPGAAVVMAIFMLAGIILLIFLYEGHKQKGLWMLKVWFYTESIQVFILLFVIVSTIAKKPELFIANIPEIAFTTYRVWACTQVKAFINEVEEEQKLLPVVPPPTPEQDPTKLADELEDTNV